MQDVLVRAEHVFDDTHHHRQNRPVFGVAEESFPRADYLSSGSNRPDDSGDGSAGFVTIEYVMAVLISMVVLVAIANLIVFEYGHGVVRAAVEQGVRQGSRTATPVASCQAAAQQVVTDLLGGRAGSMGAGVSITCTQAGGRLDANATGRFRAWLKPMPDWSFTSTATAVVEPSP